MKHEVKIPSLYYVRTSAGPAGFKCFRTLRFHKLYSCIYCRTVWQRGYLRSDCLTRSCLRGDCLKSNCSETLSSVETSFQHKKHLWFIHEYSLCNILRNFSKMWLLFQVALSSAFPIHQIMHVKDSAILCQVIVFSAFTLFTIIIHSLYYVVLRGLGEYISYKSFKSHG